MLGVNNCFAPSLPDRMELLEIAKANAAKALGTANIDLPASLKTGPQSKDTNYGKQIQGDATKLVVVSIIRCL